MEELKSCCCSKTKSRSEKEYKDLIKTASSDSQFYTIILYDGVPTHTSVLQKKGSTSKLYNSSLTYYEKFY